MRNQDIFISYSRKDINIAKTIIGRIKEETGLSCWIDLSGIESGAQFEDVIIDAIENAQVVVFLLSDNSMKSTYARQELNYALKIGKKTVPINIDKCHPQGWFLFKLLSTDVIDYSDALQKDKFFHDLCKWCGCAPSKKGELDSTSEPSEEKINKAQSVKQLQSSSKDTDANGRKSTPLSGGETAGASDSASKVSSSHFEQSMQAQPCDKISEETSLSANPEEKTEKNLYCPIWGMVQFLIFLFAFVACLSLFFHESERIAPLTSNVVLCCSLLISAIFSLLMCKNGAWVVIVALVELPLTISLANLADNVHENSIIDQVSAPDRLWIFDQIYGLLDSLGKLLSPHFIIYTILFVLAFYIIHAIFAFILLIIDSLCEKS